MTMTTATTSNSMLQGSSTSSSSSSSAAAALQKNPSSSSSSSSIHHIHHHASSTPPSLFSDDKSSSCPPSTTSSSPMMEHTQDRATSLEILPISDTPFHPPIQQEERAQNLLLANPILPISPDTAEAKRGVFYGVIVPTVEFAWSVIIFIRFGVIVGEAGVLVGLALIFATAATVALTHSAISAAATNEMPRGGVTSVLTRSLGSGIGGAITVLYYLGVSSFQTIEIYGSAEGFLKTFSASLFSSTLLDRAVVSCALLILTLIPVLLGPRFVHRISAIFMACLGVAFASVLIGMIVARPESPSPNDADNGLITGISLATLKSNLYPTAKFQLKEPLSYLVPCFVGIYVGTNKAAELRDPLRAIPIGGFTAIALSTGLYCVLFLLIGSVATRERLVHDTLILTKLAWPSTILSVFGIILVGVGSSMQCLMIASRTLVSISDMDVLPKLPFFHRFQKSNGTKGLSTLTAILITWFIAVPLVLIPDFEFLAILVTMCFLICYASTCFACFLLSVFRPPSWRPHFRAHWVFPLMGFVMCVFFMVTLNWIAALSALVGSVLLSYIIQTRSDHTTLGAGIQSLLYYMAINHLHMREEEDHQKNTRALISHCVSSHLIPPSSLSNARTLLFSADLQSEPVAFEIETSRRSNLLVEGIWRPQVIGFITFEEGEDGTLRPERRGSALVAFIGQMRSGSFRGGDLCILASVITPFDEEVAMRMFSRGRGRRGGGEEGPSLLPTPKEVVIQELLFRRKMLLRYMLEDEFVFGFAKIVRRYIFFSEVSKGVDVRYVSPTMKIGESLLMQASGLGDFTPNTVCALWPSDTGSDTEGADQQFINIRWTSLVMGQNSVFLKVAESSEFPSANQSCGGSIDIWWIFKHGEIMLLIAYLMQQSSTWKSATLRLFIISRSLEEAPLLRSEISAKLKLLRIKVHSLQVVTVQERPLTTSINLPYGEENEQTLMDLLATSTDDNTDILHPSPFFTSLKEEMYLYSKGPVTDLIMVDLPCSDDWIVDSFERTMGQLLFRALDSLCDKLDRVVLVGTGSRFKNIIHSYK